MCMVYLQALGQKVLARVAAEEALEQEKQAAREAKKLSLAKDIQLQMKQSAAAKRNQPVSDVERSLNKVRCFLFVHFVHWGVV